MSDDKKTIQFNSSLMSLGGSNKTKKNRKPKKEKPKQVIKPNQLKRDLLEKIKKHQQSQKIKNNPNENNINSDNPDVFHNDFMDSLDYLDKLSSKEKANKKKRKNKTVKNPIHNGGTSHNISFNDSQLVSVDLPNDFDIKPSNGTLIHLNDMFSHPEQQLNKASPIISSQPPIISSQPPIISSQSPIISSQPIGGMNITNPNNIIGSDTPYGCLKGGSKPTFRQLHNKTLKNYTNNDNHKSQRQHKLLALQKSHKKIRQKTIKTKKYTYNLGKKNNNISILIKNNKTRRNIKREHGLLKQKPLQEIKKYLYERNLLKIGSNAPNDVLRTLYEQSILAGDINNVNNSITLHNFIEK